ncbi:MAG: N-6 DNA methylase [Chloroflexi bacterium]|nr:N-6 DNA methylase [Chloroflexota bacterium]
MYAHIAGQPGDITSADSSAVEARIRRAHSTIWAGGKRDPLTAFDEWSKLLFAKVIDEKTTPTGQPRRFQVGANETAASVATRIHTLFAEACRSDPSIFSPDVRIALPDNKVVEVVRALQPLSFTRSDVDTIGTAFEGFFGGIFRGELGQYFTMRQLARFTVAMLDIRETDYVLDPTCGSGGFLLEALLQTWHGVDERFAGQPPEQIERLKVDFAGLHVYGIEIHEILARVCKINLLLHHDGHTNVVAGATCLDTSFPLPRLNPPSERFSRVVGNPPFGDTVRAGDEDLLGANSLGTFTVAAGRRQADSDHVILERSIDLLEPSGRLRLVLPDGLLNNQGEQSNCPQVRLMLATRGRVDAVVSLPDFAFRKSGAQNKTSILFFTKYTHAERRALDRALQRQEFSGLPAAEVVHHATVLAGLNYRTFLAEANHVGYTTTGAQSPKNELYHATPEGRVTPDQTGTVLGEWRLFKHSPDNYQARTSPDCVSVAFDELWAAHSSHRLDPKYHLFLREAARARPPGWESATLGTLMRRRLSDANPGTAPEREFTVMTIAQTGEIRPRIAGKGKTPPEWLGSYLAETPSSWYSANAGDVVFSSIDLWKGCISVVPPEFDGAIVTKEFPIYEVMGGTLDPEFLQILLRSRYYQRAFRAITTGHSNRRRTQSADFEALEIHYPPTIDAQREAIREVLTASHDQRLSRVALASAVRRFDNAIDGRGDEALPELEDEGEVEQD